MRPVETIHVLDLFCGSKKPCSSTSITPPLLRSIRERFPTSGIHYVSIDAILPSPRPEKTDSGIQAEHHQISLNLIEPDVLRKQLKNCLGDRRFDEIHAVLEDTKQQTQGKSSDFFKVISDRLNPGGVFRYMSSASRTAFLDLPVQNFSVSNVSKEDAFERNYAHIQGNSGSAGLSLEEYGMRISYGWLLTMSKTTQGPMLQREYGLHTDWPIFGCHFVILRKKEDSGGTLSK